MTETLRIVPEQSVLGARVAGVDLASPLADGDARAILDALGTYGVLCFPGQEVAPAALSAFAARFGELEINVANRFHAEGHPEVMILSNMVEDGRPIGFADAGQGWHTDMSYCRDVGLATILHARKVPVRGGRALGNTEFRNMHRAYEDLPEDVKKRIDGRVALHDFAKFWDMMRERPGSDRLPLSEAQRTYRPPVPQPIALTHPVTRRKVLYCNPGYALRIEGMEPAESDALLDVLFRHQAQDRYLHAHRWQAGDVLMWDDIGTTHNAVADYGPDEPRFMWRVQVIAPGAAVA
jgi:taurine dioxygenase